MLLGVAAVKHFDGRVEGKRAKLFSYTGKTIVTQKDYEKQLQDEITKIKSMFSSEMVRRKEDGLKVLGKMGNSMKKTHFYL